MEDRPDACHPPWLPRAVGIGRVVSMLFEQVDGALSLELCSDVDNGPAEECTAAACDKESDDVACSAHVFETLLARIFHKPMSGIDSGMTDGPGLFVRHRLSARTE